MSTTEERSPKLDISLFAVAILGWAGWPRLGEVGGGELEVGEEREEAGIPAMSQGLAAWREKDS